MTSNIKGQRILLPSATPARSVELYRPAIIVSRRPIPIAAICVPMSGKAKRKRVPVSFRLFDRDSDAGSVENSEFFCTD